MTDPRPWRVRVRRAGGGVAGAGVLIDRRHVLTCAHVVDQALGRSGQQQQQPPASEVEVDFVESQAAPLGARVVEGGWVPVGPDGGGDVAVLQLAAEAPAGARPAVLRQPPRLGGHGFDTYGYPRHYDTGLGANGVLAAWGGPGNQWVELQGVEAGHRVEGGFSGAAVYDQDAQAVVGIVVAEDRLAEAKLAWMLPVRALTQLLEKSWPRILDLVRAGGMYGSEEQAGHWSPKARGVERESKGGWYFTGRTQLLGELAAWLAVGQADGRVRVVTGGPGSGKSAVLARLVTLSDPLYRERVPKLDLTDPTVPPARSIEVAVWARNKTIEEVVAAIAQATGVDAAAPDGLINGLLERGRPCTVVVDALDEAVEPGGIAGKLVRPLAADAASVGVRVLIGSRPGREDELIAALGRDAVRFDLDQPPYLEREDLVEFVTGRLLLGDDPAAPTPYRDKPALADRVAAAVAARAYPTFLVAQLSSKALVQADRAVDVETPGWELAFPGSVVDAMDGYLDRLADDAPSQQERRARKRRLRELLSPLAYAEGGGLPRALWLAAASGLAERSYGPEELDWLLHTAADYLIEQVNSDGDPIYRLYHQALADYLRPATVEEASTQRRLADALFAQVPSRPGGSGRDWSAAHPYLTRHLASHAARAGLLDELLVDPGFLLAADPARLLHALPATSTSAGRQAAGVFRLAVHQLRDCPVEEAAAYLELTARQQHADDLADGIQGLGFAQPWSARWAVWQPAPAHHILGRHSGEINGVAVAELDGRPVVVSGGADGTVRVWELATGEPIRAFTGHTDAVRAVAVAEFDGRPVVVSGGADGTVQVWELATGQLVRAFTGGTHWVNVVAAAELDGRPVVVSGAADGTVRVWELATGEPIRLLTGHIGGINGVAVAELDGRPVVVSGGADRTVRVWELATGEPIRLLTGHSDAVWAVAVAEFDGRPVVVSGADRTVRVWELATGQLVRAFTGGTHWVNVVAVTELDGRPVVVSGGADGRVRVWELATGEPAREFTGNPGGINGVAVAELDGRPVVVSGGADGTVRVWELATGEPAREFTGNRGGVRAVAVAELDGRPVVVSGGADRTVRVWELASGQPIIEFTGHRGGVRAVAVAELDGRPVVVSGVDGTVQVWELATGEPIREFTGYADGVWAVAAAELDGRPVVVSGGADGMMQVWELATGQLIRQFTGPSHGIRGVAVAELDGRPVVVSGGATDGTVQVWELATGEPTREFTGNLDWVLSVAVAELDGRPVVVSGSADGTVQVWELAGGEMIMEFTGHPSGVWAVAAAEFDGRPVVVSGAADGTVQVWELPSRQVNAIETGSPVEAIVCVSSSRILVATAAGFALLRLREEDQGAPPTA
jgi:WD40 repeat protein